MACTEHPPHAAPVWWDPRDWVQQLTSVPWAQPRGSWALGCWGELYAGTRCSVTVVGLVQHRPQTGSECSFQVIPMLLCYLNSCRWCRAVTGRLFSPAGRCTEAERKNKYQTRLVHDWGRLSPCTDTGSCSGSVARLTKAGWFITLSFHDIVISHFFVAKNLENNWQMSWF